MKKLKSCLIVMFTIITTFSFQACKSSDDQMRCLQKETNELQDDKEYQVVHKALSDTIQSWIDRGIRKIIYLSREPWKVDDLILFSEDKKRCLAFILNVDTNAKTKLDDVQYIKGEKRNNKWFFYHGGLPILYIDILSRDIQARFSHLSEMAKREVIGGGYYKKFTCTVDYDYINGWFKEDFMPSYEDFLKDTVIGTGTVKFAEKINPQKMEKYIEGTALAGTSYFISIEDAQKVLDAYHAKKYILIREYVAEQRVLIQVKGVVGRYVDEGSLAHNVPAKNVPTSTFMIVSTDSPRVIPINPDTW